MSNVTVSVSMTKKQQGAMYMENMRLKQEVKFWKERMEVSLATLYSACGRADAGDSAAQDMRQAERLLSAIQSDAAPAANSA